MKSKNTFCVLLRVDLSFFCGGSKRDFFVLHKETFGNKLFILGELGDGSMGWWKRDMC